jgi:hypothetical protein
MSIDATLGDQPATFVWPNNTNPQPVDGAGTTALLLEGISVYNGSASACFVRFFNSDDSPTMGTSTPAFVIGVPTAGTVNRDMPRGISFDEGCWVSVTQGAPLTDNTALAANEVILTINYRN